jgi:hypothetical protein
MKGCRFALIPIILSFSITIIAVAQDPLLNVLKMGYGDVAAIRKKAEGGDAQAQVSLAGSLASNLRCADALQWYRRAASQGSIDAVYHVGNMFLFGRVGIPKDQCVEPDPPEGIRWTFRAATNRHADACWNMSKALQRGIGVTTNLVEAYAWLQVAADLSMAPIVQRVQLNNMALIMDSRSIEQAQALAQRFKAGGWRCPAVRTVSEFDPRLKLNGVTVGGKSSFCIINGKTLSEGESAKIPLKPRSLLIRCIKIEKESVLISIEGEDGTRSLRLK